MKYPAAGVYKVKKDGSVWTGDHWDVRLSFGLEKFDPTGDEPPALCPECHYATFRGESRHRRSCPNL